MRHVLLYADSLSWGIVPGSRNPLAFEKRWPGVMENVLVARGQKIRVIEDCLNGRRTVWDDPFKPGRNGRAGIEQQMEIHSPLDLVILMLGTNDFQSMHTNNAWHSSQGIASLVNAIRQAPIEPGMPIPPVLIIVPPLIREPKGTIAPKFAGAETRCVVDRYL
jgi:lysophospholipase L1-like esterase